MRLDERRNLLHEHLTESANVEALSEEAVLDELPNASSLCDRSVGKGQKIISSSPVTQPNILGWPKGLETKF